MVKVLAEKTDAPAVLIVGAEDEMLLRALFEKGVTAIGVSGIDWNRDLSPWPSPAVLSGGGDFSGEADRFLSRLTDDILPAAESEYALRPRERIIAGYSLAGLFSLYALYRTALFSRCASASGSLWYDGFLDFARENRFAGEVSGIALSLGDREAETKIARMKTVEENTRALAMHYRSLGVPTSFVLGPGGHFHRPGERMLAAILAALAL